MSETIPELVAPHAPETVRPSYDALAFPLIERFAEGGETPFAPPSASWIRLVERFPGLYDCTFNIRR
jgi:hypothetical protein